MKTLLFGNKYRYILNRGWFIWICSIFLVVLYNAPIFFSRISINPEVSFLKGLYSVALECLLGILVLSLFLSIFIFSKILLRFWVYFFIILSAVFTYYSVVYSVFVDELFIGSVFETDIGEVQGIFSGWLLVWFLFAAVIPLWFLIFKVRFTSYKQSSIAIRLIKFAEGLSIPVFCWFLLYGLIMVFNNNLINNPYMFKNTLASYAPFNYVAGMYQYGALIKKYKVEDIKDITTIHDFKVNDNNLASKDMNIILVIGESARSDHQSLNGYKRNTNPELSKIKNVTSYPNVMACGTLSRVSVSCILSAHTKQTFSFPIMESNIISVFNHLGFDSAFLSSQSMYEVGANSFFIASRDAKKIVFANTMREHIPSNSDIYDEYLLPFMDSMKASKNKKRFIVVYFISSHTPYHTRYPEKFKKFTPDSGRGMETMINSYDNSVVYTDYVLSEIIKKFKDENTFLYYVSDHGESLGEDGKLGHGDVGDTTRKEQLNVAQFIWASDSMIKLLGNKYNNIVAKKNKDLSQDNVFSTLLDCIGISAPVIKKDLSLCQPETSKK